MGDSNIPPPQVPATDADIEKIEKAISASYDKALAYSKVILGLGYAALLAIWSGTKQVMSEPLLIASALLIVMSILAYITFEIGSMVLNSWMHWKWYKAISHSGVRAAIQQNEDRQRRSYPLVMKVWLVTAIFAVLTGLGAAGILIYAFCRRLLGLA